MYLKEINAQGFKSFADKLRITLDNKTTCIVGPNGSGKSNIVDAVRWVLGEQSVKALRGDQGMIDVIFSGSKSRNPLNVASVSLTFDNSDNYLNIPYNEVCVKRRVYRTGENEYFLNGDKCRLKDITDLFLDSGIGRDSFNIISQGEVQKILSNSANDRRSIFEGAAGVLKYKKRKEEAIRKLDRTHNNLDRVNDIIEELKTRVEPLKEQSKKARVYLEVKEKLEKIEVGLLAHDIEESNYILEQNKKKIEDLNNKLLNISLKSDTSDTNLLEKKNELSKLDAELSSMNNKLLELIKKEEQINSDKKILKERSKYSASDVKVHDNIANLKEEKLRLENDIYLIDKDLNDKDELEGLKELISKEELNLTNKRNLNNKNINDFNNKKRELVDTIHQIEVLSSFIENGGALNNSVKSILNNPRLKGIHNVLGNLIDVDETYIKALEIAISPSKQFIITDNEINAKEAIEYLRENKLGRATFFPLNVIKPKGIDFETLNTLKEDKGFIDTFINLITFDKKYYNIMANQLGNVIVAATLDDANRISKKINNRYKIVTLEGDVIHIGGSMSGGSLKFSKSIITEKRDLEVLKRKELELKEITEVLDKDINRGVSEIAQLEEKIFNLRQKLIALEEINNNKLNNLNSIKVKLEEVEKELSNLNHVVDFSLSSEEEKLINSYYEVNREKEDLEKEIKIKNKLKDNLNVNIEELEAINKINNSESLAINKELKELELSNNRYEIRLDNYLNILNEEYELTFEKARDNYILEIDIEDARNNVKEYRSTLKRIGMVNIDSIEEYETVNNRYSFLTSQKEDLLNAEETLLEIIEEMDTVMKEEFITTFNKIKEEFKKVFKELFNGGNADLKLTDEKNILETGIEIVASPPGKKLTSISLLSGGEKTLTAISLIFAILNVRPIPFCLFDEVEAALDEANVDRFGTYLDHYKDKTQFLIITHKSKTMEYADTLYGITMQESGVSKLVSVKLDSIEK